MYRTIFFICILFLYSLQSRAEKFLTFPNACQKGDTIVIAAVGDILLHRPLQIIGLQKGFQHLWYVALPFLQSSDIAYANLEGPLNENNHPGTSYPLFSYPISLAPAIKNSGFTIVSTANNHALDRSAKGIDDTIDALDEAKVAYIGTRQRASSRSWVYMMTAKNIKIAWIACTVHTNGILDSHNQILYCYKKSDRAWIMETIRNLKSKVDAIIVIPHWGEQYEYLPNSTQIHFAHEVLEAGAIAVLGSHPHVLQPLEKYMTQDKRATLIIYSLGNFVSFQGTMNNRTSIILLFGLTKNKSGTSINGVRYIPIYMENRSGLENITLKRLPHDENSVPYRIITRVLPEGNASFSNTITNSECY